MLVISVTNTIKKLGYLTDFSYLYIAKHKAKIYVKISQWGGAKLQQTTQNPARETKQMRFGMKGYQISA